MEVFLLNFAVVPLVGTWIEILFQIFQNIRILSFPSWERGLKSLGMALGIEKNAVVPLVGTWIEMCKIYVRTPDIFVVPLVGTWIEIVYTRSKYHYFACRSPRGNVD